MAQTSTFTYGFFRPIIGWGTSFLYRKVVVKGMDQFPTDRPVVIISNHQNAMMDPVMICVNCPKQLHWLTRSDVFKNPTAAKFLRNINMLPVYRDRDLVEGMRDRNDQIFAICNERLAENAVVALFPEGTHRGKKQLMTPLKKGLSRLVFGAIEQDKRNLELLIVPIGLDYSGYFDYREEMIVVMGKPIEAKAYYEMYKQEPARAANLLMADAGAALSELIIDVRQDEHYDDILAMKPLCDTMANDRSVFGKFLHFKAITKHIEHHDGHFARLLKIAHHYRLELEELGIEEAAMHDFQNPVLRWVIAPLIHLIMLPFMIGAMAFLPLYLLTENFVASKVKDPLFNNSIRVVFWTFLTPFLLLLGFFAVTIAGLGWKLGLLWMGFTVLSGLLVMPWWTWFKRWRSALHFSKVKKENAAKFEGWIKTRTDLIHELKLLNR